MATTKLDANAEEGLDFSGAWLNKFAQNPTKTQARQRAERRAGRTPKQRARQAVRTVQINFRAKPEVKTLAQRVADHLNCSIADVMERAIDELAKLEKLK